MKIQMIIALLYFMMSGSGMVACASKDSFTLKGKITGLDDGTILELVPGATHKQEKPMATAILTGGEFTFNGQAEKPLFYQIRVKDTWADLAIVVENGVTACITAQAEKGNQQGKETLTLTHVEISGSPVHDEFLKKIAFKKEQEDLYAAYHKKYAEVISEMNKIRKTKNQALIDSMQNSEGWKQFENAEKEFFTTVEKQIQEAVMENKDSWWGPFLMLYNMNWFDEEQKEWFNQFSPEVQQSYYGQIVYKELFPETLEGKMAPDFMITDVQGKNVTLYELAVSKKYVLIDFWASWCGPCRREIPNLKAIYKEFAPKGLEIISVSTDREETAWKKALEAEQLPWLNMRDQSGIFEAYGGRTIPLIVLIDHTGKVLSVKLRGEALKARMQELLN